MDEQNLNDQQFGPWKMTPTMKAVHEYMKTRHVGVENRGGMWDIAAATVTNHKKQYLTNAKHEAHFEALNRLIDNGIVKKNSGDYHNGDDIDTAWIPVEGEKTVKELYMEELEHKFGSQ
jgi:hypothetical protein